MNNNDSQFVHFQSAADLDAIPGGSTFASTWRIRNNGATDWKLGYHLLRHNTGLIVRKRIPLFEATGKRSVAPGEEVDATILFTAPKEPGQYRHVFQLADDKGKPFGDQFWIEIVVVDEEEARDVDEPPISPADEKLQTGMNINPDANDQTKAARRAVEESMPALREAMEKRDRRIAAEELERAAAQEQAKGEQD